MIRIDITISGPRGCGKTFFLNQVEHVVHMIWRNVTLTKKADISNQVPTEQLTIEIEGPKHDPYPRSSTGD